jgi:ribosome-associated protein
MPRKFKKGYYVQGQFVAEGSELDIEYKAELKGTDSKSRTDLKRESTELQDIGEALIHLRKGLLLPLNLSEKMMDALADAKRITNFEGKRRQMQFIGKLMRQLQISSPATLEAIKQALIEQDSGSASTALAVHQTEQWRDKLITSDDSFGEWVAAYPATDTQQLRALIRQARKDAQAKPIVDPTLPTTEGEPAPAPKHGRAFREIFQLVREQLTQDEEVEDDAPL